MPVYIVIQIFSAGGHSTRGSTRGPRGPKKLENFELYFQSRRQIITLGGVYVILVLKDEEYFDTR